MHQNPAEARQSLGNTSAAGRAMPSTTASCLRLRVSNYIASIVEQLFNSAIS